MSGLIGLGNGLEKMVEDREDCVMRSDVGANKSSSNSVEAVSICSKTN